MKHIVIKITSTRKRKRKVKTMIQITEKLRIVKADDKNLVIEELRDVTSQKSQTTNKQWCWCGYYGDLKTALIGALHKQLFDSAEEELQIKDLVERIESVENNIKNMKVVEDLK